MPRAFPARVPAGSPFQPSGRRNGERLSGSQPQVRRHGVAQLGGSPPGRSRHRPALRRGTARTRWQRHQDGAGCASAQSRRAAAPSSRMPAPGSNARRLVQVVNNELASDGALPLHRQAVDLVQLRPAAAARPRSRSASRPRPGRARPSRWGAPPARRRPGHPPPRRGPAVTWLAERMTACASVVAGALVGAPKRRPVADGEVRSHLLDLNLVNH